MKRLSLVLVGCGRIAFDPLGDGSLVNGDAWPPAAFELAPGGGNTCARTMAGDVWCWGRGDQGGTGSGITNDTGTPVRFGLAKPALSIETSDAGSCARTSDGGAMCWGYNDLGQLGVGAPGITLPAPITGITNIVQIAIGRSCACVRTAAGGVACSGANFCLGDGSTGDRSTFALIPGLAPASSITSGDDHACALLEGGSVTCWGLNAFGQLGDGSMTDRPTAVPGPIGPYESITAGDTNTCALRGGTIDCWGSNTEGELGDNTLTMRPTAAPVANITTAIKVIGLANSNCALLRDRTVWCWGSNSSGELGIGLASPLQLAPVRLSLTDVVDIAARTGPHVCAVTSDGQVWCWGNNIHGQIGQGSVGGLIDIPTRVIGLP